MYEGRMSSLTDDELEKLEKKIIDVVCREQPSREDPLVSAALYDTLTEEGVELPDFAMHDALQGLRRALNIGLGGPQNPHADPEARTHGGVTITGVYPGICEG